VVGLCQGGETWPGQAPAAVLERQRTLVYMQPSLGEQEANVVQILWGQVSRVIGFAAGAEREEHQGRCGAVLCLEPKRHH
jgi:hypothetical protein